MKGKHGQAAAVRQEVQTRDAEIATYQRRVAQLTADNRFLRDQLRGEQQRHREVERRLRAERDNGVSPQVEALQMKLAECVRERDAARQYIRRFGEQTSQATDLLADLLVKVEGRSRDDALERAYEVLPLHTGSDVGSPYRVIDMTGTKSIAAGGKPVATGTLATRALNGDMEALKMYRAVRNARYGGAQ